ncbi:MAG TPA: hypothetical protein PKZ07_19265 [Sedimentisphaerales bacterium]|nr:hypothetical protein [Sedimentisphaerales bacterium]
MKIGALIMTAQAIAGRSGLIVQMDGQTAWTNGKLITLPILEDSIDNDLLVRGYLDHEVGHVRWTDFAVVRRKLTNILEDVRIELLQIKDYPGSAMNLDNLVTKIDQQGGWDPPEGANLRLVLGYWLLTRLRSRVLGQPVAETAAKNEARCRSVLGDELCDSAAAMADQIVQCKCTADVDRLAAEIEALWTDPPNPDSPESGSGDSDSRREEDSPGSEKGGPSGTGKGSGKNAGRKLLANEPEPDYKALEDHLEGLINQNALPLPGSGETNRIPPGYENPEDFDPPDNSLEPKLDQAVVKTARLKGLIERLIQARVNKLARPACAGKSLSRQKLHLLAADTPDKRVFAKKEKVEAVDTAVVLLLDTSGSTYPIVDTVAGSGYAFARALQGLPGLAYEIAFYPHKLGVAVLKKFAESTLNKRRFTRLRANGGTPTGPALMWAGMKLSHRKERRKMVFLFTDGEPDNPTAAAAAIKSLARLSITVITVILSYDSKTSNVFEWAGAAGPKSPYVVIKDVGDLPRELLILLRKKL